MVIEKLEIDNVISIDYACGFRNGTSAMSRGTARFRLLHDQVCTYYPSDVLRDWKLRGRMHLGKGGLGGVTSVLGITCKEREREPT